MVSRQTVPLASLAEIYDGPHATPQKTPSGPWYLNIASLKSGRFVLEESAHLSDEDYVRWTRRVRPQADDVLFSYETCLGEAALMPPRLEACLGRRMGILRARKGAVDPRYLLYAYLGPEFQETIRQRMIHGATVERIPISEMGTWPLTISALPEQQDIAEVLSSLDDKIEANRQVARLVSAVASSLFAAVAKRSALLAEVAQVLMGQSPPGSTYNEDGSGLPFYQGTRDFGFRYPLRRVWCSEPTRVAESQDVLVSVRAPVGTLNVAREKCAIGRGVASLRSKSAPSVLYYAMTSDPSRWAPFEGEGTVFGSIAREQLSGLRIEWPTEGDVGQLEETLAVLNSRLVSAESEGEILGALRDALLPKLLSGELRVREAEALVEDVV